MFELVQQSAVVPSIICYNALICAPETVRQSEHVLEGLQAMRVQGVMPNGIIYNALM